MCIDYLTLLASIIFWRLKLTEDKKASIQPLRELF